MNRRNFLTSMIAGAVLGLARHLPMPAAYGRVERIRNDIVVALITSGGIIMCQATDRYQEYGRGIMAIDETGKTKAQMLDALGLIEIDKEPADVTAWRDCGGTAVGTTVGLMQWTLP